MSQLLTQCPFCQTTFKVSDAQLQIASGVVRCGSCMEVFLATQHRVILKDKPASVSSHEPAPELSAEFPESRAPVDSDSDYADTFTASSEPAWQVVDAQEEPASEDNVFNDDEDESDDENEYDDFDVNEPTLGDGLVDETDEEADEDSYDDEVEDQDDNDYDLEHEVDDDDDLVDTDELLSEDYSDEDDFDDELDELPAQHAGDADQSNAFSSWEAEEAFHAANDPVEPDAEDFDGEQEEDELQADTSDFDMDDEDSSSDDQQPAYGGMLNPTGYAMTNFSVDYVLPKTSPIDEALENDPAMWDEPDEWDEPDDSDESNDALDDEPSDQEDVSGQSGETEPATLAGSQQPAAARTAVIVPEKTSSIPTLVPDVVASEDIPAEGLGAQTMAWFQSFRKSIREKIGQDEDYSGTDEKAAIRSHLFDLRHEDSLEPVASEALDALDEAPVELPYNLQQWQSLKTAGMIAASILLVLGLGLQYAWFNLDTLVLERRMTGITGLLCKVSDCPDTQLIDLTSLVTEELVVRSHPGVEDALQVNFIFRNDRNREQPFPLVELNFTDIDGDIIANRVFTSEEYMPGEMQLFTHMPAHSSIQVSLDLVDPGSEATGYSLVFRNP